MNKLQSIQCLRAFAVLMVVVFHAGLSSEKFLSEPLSEYLSEFLKIGAAGVDIFFVISGFIIWAITHNREHKPLQFMLRRIIRIAPLYWLMTGLYIALNIAAGMVSFLGEKHTEIDLSHILQSLFFIPHESAVYEGGIYPVLIQGWTLNYEMFFYLIFAGCLLMSSKHRLKAITGILLVCVIFGAFFDPQNVILKTFTKPIMLEFLMGVLIAYIWQNKKLPEGKPAFLIFIGGIFALIASSFFPEITQEYRAFFWGIPSALIIAGALNMKILQSGRKMLVAIGDASYSIYLTHTFGLTIVSSLWLFLPSTLHSVLGFWIYTVICLIGASIGGVIVYHLIERPIDKALKKRLP